MIFENFCQNLKQQLSFLRRYYAKGASCVTGAIPDFYVEDGFLIDAWISVTHWPISKVFFDWFNPKPVKSNLESIVGSIQAYHDAVFIGSGKKCDCYRNIVTNNIGKVKIVLIFKSTGFLLTKLLKWTNLSWVTYRNHLPLDIFGILWLAFVAQSINGTFEFEFYFDEVLYFGKYWKSLIRWIPRDL